MTTQCIAPHDLDMKKPWESTCELSACKRITSHDGRNPKTTIVVPLLTCSCLWHRFQKEAEDWIAPGGILIADLQARPSSHLLNKRHFILVNANFTPIAINTAPMVRSNQCPIRANPARTRCWLNSMATRQNHNAVATARYTP